jgi:glutamate--cysteine ligase
VRLGVDPATVELVAEYRDRYVARGRCPADDRLAEWTRDGSQWPAPAVRTRERA